MYLRKLAQLYTMGEQEAFLIGKIPERAAFFSKKRRKTTESNRYLNDAFPFDLLVLGWKAPFFLIKMTKNGTYPSRKDTR